MITIETDSPVALTSLDHTHPHGTAWDNSIHPGFNSRLFALTSSPRLLDIGCAGGGLVRSVIDDGGFAVGIEGSDYSQVHNRAEWATIPDNLFTADATKPFTLKSNGEPCLFDIITLWEVFEHIAESDIAGVLDNIKRHLLPDGVVVASICTASAGLSPDGTEHHVTTHQPEWWYDEVFYPAGFVTNEELRSYFDGYWVRGVNTGCADSFCNVFQLV